MPAMLPHRRLNGPRIIAFANMKGGVGKSTAAMFTVELMALRGASVLAVDLDPQANLSIMLMTANVVEELKRDRATINEVFERIALGERPSAVDFVRPHVSELSPFHDKPTPPGRVDLIAAAAGVRFSELKLEFRLVRSGDTLAQIRKAAERTLEDFLRSLMPQYNVIAFDCPPSLTLMAQAAIAIADLTVTPVIPDEISAVATTNFIDTISNAENEDFNMTDRTRVRMLFSKYRSTQLANQVVRRLRANSGLPSFSHTVRHTDVLARSGLRPSAARRRTLRQKYGSELDRLGRIVNEIEELIGVPHVPAP